jgi:GH24 family phage-related lysozyme (muramidase)
MIQRDFAAIPDEIRSMQRLWRGRPNSAGLLIRRRLEAALFEQGLKRST